MIVVPENQQLVGGCINGISLCDFRSEPGNQECWRAIWSEGRACQTCYRDDCYRCGWERWQVEADNRVLVKRRIAQLTEEGM